MANRVSGLVSGMDTEQLVTAMVSNYKLKVDKNTKLQTKLSWSQDAWKDVNKKVYSLYTSISNLRYSSGYNLQKVSLSDSTKATATASGAVNGTQKLNVLKLAQTASMTGAKVKAGAKADSKLSDLGYKNHVETTSSTTTDEEGNEVTDTKERVVATSFTIKTKDDDGNEVLTKVNVTEDTKLSDIVNQFSKAGLTANFDAGNGRFYISSKKEGSAGDFSIEADAGDEYSAKALEALGFVTNADSTDTDKYATAIKGQDAQIRLNGVLYTSTNNSFSVNGLTINATGVTGDGDEKAITVNVNTDTQGIYDKIKDFLTQYNNVINELTKLYNAESASDYEPLTDEEKEAMSEKEIEKWEDKIKGALLRRDTTLNSVMQSMMMAMANPVTVGDNKISLSTYGIKTLGFLNAAKNEQNAYHIDGDEDDENTSGQKDKLMVALSENPEEVVDFMKGLATNLYNAIGDKMKSTTLSSAYTIYNDKQMEKQYSNYTKVIKEWEKKLSDKEDSYYKKFANMEAQLSKLQGQTSSLTGLIGQ